MKDTLIYVKKEKKPVLPIGYMQRGGKKRRNKKTLVRQKNKIASYSTGARLYERWHRP